MGQCNRTGSRQRRQTRIRCCMVRQGRYGPRRSCQGGGAGSVTIHPIGSAGDTKGRTEASSVRLIDQHAKRHIPKLDSSGAVLGITPEALLLRAAGFTVATSNLRDWPNAAWAPIQNQIAIRRREKRIIQPRRKLCATCVCLGSANRPGATERDKFP